MRLKSLDVFRGMTIAGMILVNTPGSWSHVYSPLLHADWHGCSPTDLVFPFFLFIAGVSSWFSFSKFDHQFSKAAASKILKRAAIIFFIGLLLNWFPFYHKNIADLRIMGVLQRIGLAYGFGVLACLYFKNAKQLIGFGIFVLLAYWAMLWLGSADPYSLEHSLVRKIDLFILGDSHVWHGKGIAFDPEGLLSTLPAIGTVIIGYLVGGLIQSAENYKIAVQKMIIAGFALTAIGWIWGLVFPINKSLWTSSYVLYTGGIAMILLAIFLWIIDVKKKQKWAFPFVVFGSNSIFVFVLSGLWVKTYFRIKHLGSDGEIKNAYHYIYSEWFEPAFGAMNGSLFFAIAHITVFWLILLWMYKRKIFIKV